MWCNYVFKFNKTWVHEKECWEDVYLKNNEADTEREAQQKEGDKFRLNDRVHTGENDNEMDLLRGAHFTMTHNGKQLECMGGFQGGRGVCGYWGQVA